MRHDSETAAGTAQGSSDAEMSEALDNALQTLRTPDRTALVMHYFQGCAFGEVAVALKTTPEGARKRIERAVQKLRGYFARHGIEAVSPAAVATWLTNAAATKAPEALHAKAGTLASSGNGAGGAGVAAIVAETLAVMTAAKVKLAALFALTAVVAIGGVMIAAAIGGDHDRSTRQANLAPSIATAGPSAPRDALTRLAEAVRNGDGQAAKAYAYVEQPSDQAFLDEAADTIRLVAELRAEYRRAFGDAAADKFPTLFGPQYVPPDAPVVISGDRCIVQIGTWKIPMINDAGAWKVPTSSIAISTEVLSSQQKTELARRNNLIYAELTRAIVAGEFDSSEGVLKELRARTERVRDAARRSHGLLRIDPATQPTTASR